MLLLSNSILDGLAQSRKIRALQISTTKATTLTQNNCGKPTHTHTLRIEFAYMMRFTETHVFHTLNKIANWMEAQLIIRLTAYIVHFCIRHLQIVHFFAKFLCLLPLCGMQYIDYNMYSGWFVLCYIHVWNSRFDLQHLLKSVNLHSTSTIYIHKMCIRVFKMGFKVWNAIKQMSEKYFNHQLFVSV